MLASSFLSYKIGGDLFSTAYARHSRETEVLIQVTKAYVMSLAVFDHLMNKNCEATKNFPKKTDLLAHLEGRKKNILYWLNGFMYFNVEKDLKVSALSLSLSLIILRVYIFPQSHMHLRYLLSRNLKLNWYCFTLNSIVICADMNAKRGQAKIMMDIK